MSQETSSAAAVGEVAALSASVSWLVNAALCQHVGGQLWGESICGCGLYYAGCGVRAPFKGSPPYFSGS